MLKQTPRILLLLTLLSSSVDASVAPIPVPISSALPLKPDEKMLSAVIYDGFLGIHLEPLKEQNKLKANAQVYVNHRKHRLSKASEATFRKDCSNPLLSNPALENPFCLALKSVEETNAGLHDNTAHKKKPTKLKSNPEITEWIKSAEIEKLLTPSPEAVQLSLKKISQLEDLNAITQKVVQSSNCALSTLSSLLGAKTEEYLPLDDARTKAIQLYKKAIQCEIAPLKEETRFRLRSRLRLSLLYIWGNDCQSALPHLKLLSNESSATADLHSKALFWQNQCGVLLKKPELTAEASQTLLDKYPMSLQSLVVESNKPSKQTNFTPKSDSPLLLRIPFKTESNERLRAVEALIEINELKFAKEMIEKIDSNPEKTPPGFKLYLAALYSRLDDSVRRFRLLNSVFKEEPSLISKTALELFYPQTIKISQNTFTNKIDGMLLLSLIRQESAFNSKAKSPAGAIGLMQIMPNTARRLFRLRSSQQLYDPGFNVKVGSRYFSELLKTYDGDAELALAAYNAGPKRVEDWIKRYPVKDRILFLDLIPFHETQDYVTSIARNYFWYVSLYAKSKPVGTQRQQIIEKVFSLFRS